MKRLANQESTTYGLYTQLAPYLSGAIWTHIQEGGPFFSVEKVVLSNSTKIGMRIGEASVRVQSTAETCLNCCQQHVCPFNQEPYACSQI